MEASENTTVPRGSGGASPHRVDPDRIARSLSVASDPAGYARLNLMVSTIFERLVEGERRGES